MVLKHLDEKGKISVCKAKPGNCPLRSLDGREPPHFSDSMDIKEIQILAEQENCRRAELQGFNEFGTIKKPSKKEKIKKLEKFLSDKDVVGCEKERLELYKLKQDEDGKVHTQADVADLIEKVDGGGFTYGTGSERGIRSIGFAVSPYPERCVVVKMDDWKKMTKSQKVKTLKKYIDKNKDLLDGKDNYFGGWNDTDSGLLYLDVSIVVDDPYEAVDIAEERDQIAYFDFQTGKDVTVDKNAKSGQAEPPS